MAVAPHHPDKVTGSAKLPQVPQVDADGGERGSGPQDPLGFADPGHTGYPRLAHTLHYKEIRISRKLRVIRCETLSPNSEFRRCDGTSPVAPVVNLALPWHVYHTKRPLLFTTR